MANRPELRAVFHTSGVPRDRTDPQADILDRCYESEPDVDADVGCDIRF